MINQGRTKRGWSTAGAALSAMLSVTLTRPPVSTLIPAPAVPALETFAQLRHTMNDSAELLWRMCNEHYTQARQHETQRASMTTMAATIAVAATGFMTLDRSLTLTDLPLSIFLVAVGLFGAIFSAKHYERFQFHVARSRALRRELERMHPDVDMAGLRDAADKEHKKDYPRLYDFHLHRFWIGLHVSIALLGLIIVTIILCDRH